MKTCFIISVWENTYRDFLTKERLRAEYNNIGYPFDEKYILINNVLDKDDVIHRITRNFGDFEFVFVENFSYSILKKYAINPESLKKGYYYTIQHLAKFYFPKAKYVFSTSEDCSLYITKEFIQNSISIMEWNSSIICSMPSWDKTMVAPQGEAIGEIDNFWIASGFTDQVFFANGDIFRQKIYNYYHPDSERYPAYGGECFEKRVNSFMKCKNKFRIIDKGSYYIHG